jgi:hypothetical protein
MSRTPLTQVTTQNAAPRSTHDPSSSAPLLLASSLAALTRSEENRAALIGRLSQREDATWLAELLIEIETDPDDITRLRLIDGLERALC